MYRADPREASRKAEIAGILEKLGQVFDLSEAQHDEAKGRYEAVGAWLAGGDHELFEGVSIYPQGSTSLGTTVRPNGQQEYDVDLVCFLPHLRPESPPAVIKRLVGDRLREHGRYKDLLEEKLRCWRINYANEFHLDITPSIANPWCPFGGELVPDKNLKIWKDSNPKGYQALFEQRASLQPRLRFAKSAHIDAMRDHVEPYPARMEKKGVLRRTVQLAKAHRNSYFADDAEFAPISVIITTLAALSYEDCVRSEYDNEFDLLADVIGGMPRFIENEIVGGQRRWRIQNETTTNENFAEKWNLNPDLAEAFFQWHNRAHQDLANLNDQFGMDVLQKSLATAFGPGPVKKAFDMMTEDVSAARSTGRLIHSPMLGLSVGASEGAIVRPNTFFGAE